MRRKEQAPLPMRRGLAPSRLRTPARGPWATYRDFLLDRLPTVEPRRIDTMFRLRRFIGPEGPLTPDTPFAPNSSVWFHRDPPEEVPVPFELAVIHRDDTLVVVDKPHYLATTPRGMHVLETALVRLRHRLDLPELSPAHRLDRPTAGLVMFTVAASQRGAYQRLFDERLVHKEYEAIAALHPDLTFPRTVRSRIVKRRSTITAEELPGTPNAETRVELLEHDHGLGRYRLIPRTGRTHQLRLHMSSLGIPIVGDDFYPTLTEKAADDFSRPLQLLARALEFTDPITGAHRRFESARTLQAWTSFDSWANS